MNVKDLLKRKQLLAGASLVLFGVIVGLAGLMLVVLPARSHAKSLDSQIAVAQQKLVSLHGAPRSPVIHAADLFQLVRAMPDQPELPTALLDLANAAARTKVVVNAVTPAAPIVQADGATAIPLRLTVEATWGQLSAFLHDLRTEVQATKTSLNVKGRLFVVDNVQLAAKTDSSGTLEATLNVDVFTYGTPVPPPATGTTGTTTTPAPGSTQAAGATGATG